MHSHTRWGGMGWNKLSSSHPIPACVWMHHYAGPTQSLTLMLSFEHLFIVHFYVIYPLYRLDFYLSLLFSPLGKLADWAIYFAYVFFFIFFIFLIGRLSNTCFLESNGPIFTKISVSVDGWKGLLTWYITFWSLKGRFHGNQLKSQNGFFSQTNLLCRTAIPKRIAISRFWFQKIKWHEFLCLV